MFELRTDKVCKEQPEGRHVYTMHHVLMPDDPLYFKPKCECCGLPLGIDGALWVAESIVIFEKIDIEELIQT